MEELDIMKFLSEARLLKRKFSPYASYSSVGDMLFVYLEDRPSVTFRSFSCDNVEDMIGLSHEVERPVVGLKIYGIKRKGLKGYYTLREIIQLCVTDREGYMKLCEKADSNILDQLVNIS